MVNAINGLENAAGAPGNPFPLFDEWLRDAEESELNDPNAMALATVDADGRPSVRMVLLKAHDARGFVFFTNRDSRKGKALAAKPQAALCFHWKSLARAIRVEGAVEIISDEESDAYYNSRGRGSRIGAWSSSQSETLSQRSVLAARVQDFDTQFGPTDTIPRPPHWGGYRVKPSSIEFWSEGRDRLHTRLVYEPDSNGGWAKRMLFP